MDEKQLLYQIISREIGNLLGSINPSFKFFAPMIMNYLEQLTSQYLDKFISPDDDKLNAKAVASFAKQETNKKIDEFLKKFEENRDDV